MSVCFGRPDIERYITETVEGTAVTAEWADVEADAETVDMSPPASRLRQVCTVLSSYNHRTTANPGSITIMRVHLRIKMAARSRKDLKITNITRANISPWSSVSADVANVTTTRNMLSEKEKENVHYTSSTKKE